MKWKYYELVGDTGGTYVPRNHHLVVETSSTGTLYINPTADTDGIYKTTDKGLTFGSVLGPQDSCIYTALYNDITNNKIYYVSHRTNRRRFGYIDTTDDSDNDIQTATGAGTDNMESYDVLVVDTVRMVHVYDYTAGGNAGKSYLYFQDTAAATHNIDMGAWAGRSHNMSYTTHDGNGNGWFIWRWGNEDAELWKYDESATTIAQLNFAGGGNLSGATIHPDRDYCGIAYDNSDNLYFVLQVGTKEVSTIVAEVPANVNDGEYITLSANDKTATEIDYYLWFDKVGDDSGDPAPGGKTEIRCDISASVTAQDVSDVIQAAVDAVTTITGANGGGTSTTVTITSHNVGNVTNIADVDTGWVVATTTPGVAGTDTLYKYVISTDTVSSLGAFSAALMLERNTASGIQEKAFGLDEIVYQLAPKRGHIIKLADLELGGDKIEAITDTFLFTDDPEVFEYKNLSDDNIESCLISYKMGGVTTCRFSCTTDLAVLTTILFYDDSDVLLFQGVLTEKIYTDTTLFEYKATSYDKEIITYKLTYDTTAGVNAKTAVEAIIDSADWLYYSSSITDPAINIKADFVNLTFKESMDYIADRCDYVWYVAPDGKVYFNDGTTASGKTVSHTSGILEPPVFKLIGSQINKVILYGGYVNGVRLTATSEDVASQLLYGVQEYIDHYPHITDQTELNNLAAKVRARSGMNDSPYYIDVELFGQEFVQCGNTISFTFSPLSYSTANNIILSQKYEAKRDQGKFKLSTGILQNIWRGYGQHDTKTRISDEEQLDILGAEYAAHLTTYTAHRHDTHTLECDDITSDAAADFDLTTAQNLNFKVDGDDDDYIQFSTAGDVPEINTQGACDLKINPASDVDFSDNALKEIKSIVFQDGGSTVDIIRDEDNMATNDANALATQQSIKAYADLMLPLTGGEMSGNITMAGAQTVDGKDVSTLGTDAEAHAYVEANALTLTADLTTYNIVLAEGYSLKMDGTPSDDKWTGLTLTIDTTGCAVGDAVYVDGANSVLPADADAIASMPAIGIVVAAGLVLTHGVYRDDSVLVLGTPGGKVYVSTTAGDLTHTAPSGNADIVQVFGICIGTDMLFVNPSLDWVEVVV